MVLDRWLRPVPAGVAGELYLGGPGLAQGYHSRSALTAASFVADPLGGGTRLYRTGDVVRWTRTLELEYVGRSDFQVQVNGLRIELGEIDAVLARHESVDFVVTLAGGTVYSYVKIKPGTRSRRRSVDRTRISISCPLTWWPSPADTAG